MEEVGIDIDLDALVKRRLAEDFLDRKRRNWKLYPLSEWEQFVIPKNANVRSEMYIMNSQKAFPVPHHVGQKYPLLAETDMNKLLLMKYPAAIEILERFGSNLCIAGGSFTNKFYQSDLDFFFYDCSEEKANQIMLECISIIQKEFYTNQLHDLTKKDDVVVKRSKNVTTVETQIYISYLGNRAPPPVQADYPLPMLPNQPTLASRLEKTRKYQFIHRIYPTKASVIAGFDLTPSMVLYDGKEILATAAGAWAIVNGIIIVDISRRSLSFASRLDKYKNRGFAVIFPGCNQSVVDGLIDKYFKETGESKNQIAEMNLHPVSMPVYDYHGSYETDDVALEDLVLLKPVKVFADLRFGYKNLRYVADHFDPLIERNSDYANQANCSMECMNANLLAKEAYDNVVEVVYLGRHLTIKEKLFENSTIPCHKYKLQMESLGLRSKIEELRSIRSGGIEWMTQDPQRQWSSTVNPSILRGQEFYNGHWNGLVVIIPREVETMLRRARRDPNNCWSWLSNDLFGLIMEKLI